MLSEALRFAEDELEKTQQLYQEVGRLLDQKDQEFRENERQIQQIEQSYSILRSEQSQNEAKLQLQALLEENQSLKSQNLYYQKEIAQLFGSVKDHKDEFTQLEEKCRELELKQTHLSVTNIFALSVR